MGLTSGGLPSLLLSSAISLPPAKFAETRSGTFPEVRRFTIRYLLVCEEEQIWYPKGVEQKDLKGLERFL